jgi:hypothetical protein
MPELRVIEEHNIFEPNSITFDERLKQLDEEKQQDQDRLERERNSPFKNFYQFNREHSANMIKLAGKYPKSHQVLLFLLEHMDMYNAVMCSYKVLCEILEFSESTAKRAVKVLKDFGFIAVYKSGTANVYAINKNLAWSSWGTNHKYAKFGANIIIAESEQETNKPRNTKAKTLKHKEIIVEDKKVKK